MIYGTFSGYLYYVVAISIASGILLLIFDRTEYDIQNLTKEKKAAIYLGRFNIALGVVSGVGMWIYSRWFI
ncbi:hypothetical protein SD71_01295 [Cohnella kolymensis]|uniref:Uncharacterized protein n=1 Tax=Cohnella kolymensis TaxID=1590652 RepID=A0ABR5A9Q7_9BACL|nr:CLC_0170 family protein [Cohnella kolymensis]KIL37345.1 hypothetical protein SD71_01295 [Cohnella kolymensis]